MYEDYDHRNVKLFLIDLGRSGMLASERNVCQSSLILVLPGTHAVHL